jgi:hypothetical protein
MAYDREFNEAMMATPTSPRSLSDIITALSRELPSSMLETRVQGGKKIRFIPWHRAVLVLNKYAPGWEWSVSHTAITDKRLFLVGRLSIPTLDGIISREATGTELLDCGSYGDPSSNAESMAFRRCAAKFGLALYLYDDK